MIRALTPGQLGSAFTTARRNFPTDTDGTSRIWLAGGYDSSGVTLLSSMEIFECTTSGEITLSAKVRRVSGNRLVALSWTPADGGTINVLRDGVIFRTKEDDGRAQDPSAPAPGKSTSIKSARQTRAPARTS